MCGKDRRIFEKQRLFVRIFAVVMSPQLFYGFLRSCSIDEAEKM